MQSLIEEVQEKERSKASFSQQISDRNAGQSKGEDVEPANSAEEPKSVSSLLSDLFKSMEEADLNEVEMSIAMEQLYTELKIINQENEELPLCTKDLSPSDLSIIENLVNQIAIEEALEGQYTNDVAIATILSIIHELKAIRISGYRREAKTTSPVRSRARICDPPSIGRDSDCSDPRVDPPSRAGTPNSGEDSVSSSTKPVSARYNKNDTKPRKKGHMVSKGSDPDTNDMELVHDMSGELASSIDRGSESGSEQRSIGTWQVAGSSSVEMDVQKRSSGSGLEPIETFASDECLEHRSFDALRIEERNNGLKFVSNRNGSSAASGENMRFGNGRLPPTPENRFYGSRSRTQRNGGEKLKNSERSKPSIEEKKEEIPEESVVQVDNLGLPRNISDDDDATLPSFLLAESASIDLLMSETDHTNDEDERDPLLKLVVFDEFFHSVAPDGNTQDKVILAQVIRFFYPFLIDGQPTNDEFAGLKAESLGMGLAPVVVDRLFVMIGLFFTREQENLKSRPKQPSGKHNGMENFLQLVMEANPELTREKNLANTQGEGSLSSLPGVEREGTADSAAFESEEERVGSSEISEDLEAYVNDAGPLSSGLATEDDFDAEDAFVDADGDGISVGSNEAPWWEVAEKLGARSAENDDFDEDIELNQSKESSKNDDDGSTSQNEEVGRVLEGIATRVQEKEERVEGSPTNVDDDIENFWKAQEEKKERQVLPQQVESPQIETKRSDISRLTNITARYNEDTWVLKRSMAMWNKSRQNWLPGKKVRVIEVDDPETIDGVQASSHLLSLARSWSTRAYRKTGHRWQEPYKERTTRHGGYLDVDVNSLYQVCTVNAPQHHQDSLPWEHRNVKQRFLYEPSVGFCRNWFGALRATGGNKLVRNPVCRPRSMEMPMRAPGWKEDWFRAPTFAPLGTNMSGDALDLAPSPSHEIDRLNRLSYDEVESEAWEEAPECGRLKNVKLRPGDRITRLTPELTSSLRRSRWRKKHFPRGTFPY
uniref:Uncharacterized protein n=1 Tax=Entomoneis paludosa TaxID=265537 RepID=A0A7S2YQV9_9STRA